MVRHRKTVKLANVNNETSSSSGSEKSTMASKTFRLLSAWKTIAGVLCFAVAVYISILGYLETRVNTPFDQEKVVREQGASSERFWGSYRPGVYMGMKSREPRSPVFGMMWYELAPASQKGIRHWCDQGDNLPQYGWTHHDGVSFGEQVIVDPPHRIVTSFVKAPSSEHGAQWTVRVNVTSTTKSVAPFTLIWYAALDEALGPAAPAARVWTDRGAVVGYAPAHNHFKLSLETLHGTVYHTSVSEAHAPGLHQLKEKLVSLLRVKKHPALGRIAVLGSDTTLAEGREVNFIPTQMIVEPPFAADIVYSSAAEGLSPVKGAAYTDQLDKKKTSFDQQFDTKFNLTDKGYSPEDVAVAKAAMSNMIGGIGYFYGAGRVQSEHTKEPVPYWRAPLYTAVPSRSFFPRGFLWDEGFHLLLIGRWSPDIMIDIIGHWIDLINVEGWIPREQILGVEALARVPKEFVVQSNAAANPPMLLITLGKMVKLYPDLFLPYGPHRAVLSRMYTRLQAWFNWFQTTQKGTENTAYRWRGRVDDGKQLNPKSLSSGLDDYPRASHPTEIERHLDLRCWMYAAADALTTIANVLQVDSSRYEEIRYHLSDEELLNELHWSSQTHTYADYGLHTDSVRLVRQKPKHPKDEGGVVRLVSAPPQPRLVTSAHGYLSLFPMLLRVLSPNSEKLGKILESLDKPELLWSPYGLRSLSKSAPLYMKRNTETDPPYWRGQVWINMNYLALSALRHYSTEGIHAARARELHDRLRDNIVRNILKEYKRTGYLWEQYSGEDGKGSGCRPFTGWTALLVLIMAEEY